MEDSNDIEVLKKRLKKALQVAEKLKKESQLEHEVNKELARRNEALKKDLSACEERLNTGKASLFSMDSNVRLLVKLTGNNAPIDMKLNDVTLSNGCLSRLLFLQRSSLETAFLPTKMNHQ